MRFFPPILACLCIVIFGGSAFAGTEQGALLSAPLYPTVIQGFQDPVNAFVYNQAPAGSDPLSFGVSATFPYGAAVTATGTKQADGGAGYITVPFNFNSGLVNPGTSNIGVKLTDTVTNATATQNASVQVLAHARPAFYFKNTVINLSPVPEEPAAAEPSADPLAFGATGGGESFAASAPGVIGDPPPNTPTAKLDLDKVTSSGDAQITATLQPFTNLPPDDPAVAVPWQINVDTTKPGLYNKLFELDYSDEQDLPGADAPNSQRGYFEATALVIAVSPTETDVKVWITAPEPSAISLLLTAATVLSLRRQRAQERPRAAA